MSQKPLSVFTNEYLQIPTESPQERAVRELAEHCVDLMDEFDDERCRFHGKDGGFPTTPEERADCERFYRETRDELFGYARILMPLEESEWRDMVLRAMSHAGRMGGKRVDVCGAKRR